MNKTQATSKVLKSLLHFNLIGLALAALITYLVTFSDRSTEAFTPMLFATVMMFISTIHVTLWNRRHLADSEYIYQVQKDILKKRRVELFLILFGVVFGSLSLFLPLNLAVAGVCVAGTGAYLLVFTLKAEWELGLLHDIF